MANKKITDVSTVNSLKDGDSLFINSDGSLKQITKSNSGLISIDLLWTNASYTSSFNAQTIPLDLSKYPMLIIMHRTATNYSGIVASVCLNGWECRLISFAAGGTTVRTRSINYTSSGIQFYNGYESTTINNDSCIPVHIYGIKHL